MWRFLLCIVLLAGCTSGGGQVGSLQSQNRTLSEQTKTQLAEIEKLKTHARSLEDRLIESEHQLAAMERAKSESERLAAGADQPDSSRSRRD
ncbi:MAG: hypothetical protein SGJ20_10360 [Planctomycetota bacterium]|nr:hypothetical protein [Planctomycetota bacterium]